MRAIKLTTALLTMALLLHASRAAGQTGPSVYTITLEGDRHREELNFDGTSLALRFCQLQQGGQYTVWAMQRGPNQPLLSIDGHYPAVPSLTFTATADCRDLVFLKDKDHMGDRTWISISCTSCKNDRTDPSKMANLTVTGGWTDEELVNDFFLGESCFEPEKITGTGHPQSKGTFSNGSASIDLESGIIISTGYISDATGPNNFSNTGDFISGGGDDPDLDLMAQAGLFDVSGIEFDFVPSIPQISFEYVFASEEYCEFVGTGISDVFGFFISGPGINGGFTSNGENIAVIPGTNGVYVTLDSLNQNINSSYFVPNDAFCGAVTNDEDIEFDGWTSVLTAKADVVPCETYHIRLLIADVADGIYDSAIFLKENSLDIGNSNANGTSSLAISTGYTYEDCGEIYVTITRETGDSTLPQVVTLQTLASGTALPGIDHSALPAEVTIPAGEFSVVLPLDIYSDSLTEGIETIALSVLNPCTCQNEVHEIQIDDLPVLEVTLDDITTCSGENVTLSPTISGGLPGDSITYSWSTTDVSPSIGVSPNQTTTYTVTLTGDCGTSATASATVEVLTQSIATLTGSGVICQENPIPASMMLEFTGEAPWEYVYEVNGIPQTDTALVSPVTIPVVTPGSYILSGITSLGNGCIGTASGTFTLEEVVVSAQLTSTDVNCFGNGTISVSPSGGDQPYTYQWSNGAPGQPVIAGLAEGNYSVTVSDTNGCTSEDSAYVAATSPLSVEANAISGVTCSEPNGGSIAATVTGGSGNYTYSWTGGIGDIPNPSGLSEGTYWLTVTDQDGCTDSTAVIVPDDGTLPDAAAAVTNSLTCTDTIAYLSGAGSSEGTNYSYEWSGPGISGNNNELNAMAVDSGTYTLLVVNTDNGCSSTATVEVMVDNTPPLSLATGDQLTCQHEVATLDGTESGSGPYYTYNWSGPGLPAGDTSVTVQVTEAGWYELLVTDHMNGCTAVDQVLVTIDTLSPVAVIDDPDTLDCLTSAIGLDGNQSYGATYIYRWYHNNEEIPGADSLVMNVSESGVYTLLVTDPSNGCTATANVTIVEDMNAPSVEAVLENDLNCLFSTAGVFAMVNGDPTNLSFEWSTVDGSFLSNQNTAASTVNTSGSYTVLVTDQTNGCTAEATTTVDHDTIPPVVTLVSSGDLNCLTDMIQLEGTATGQGQDYTFSWSTTNGNFAEGQSTWSPLVDAPGMYELTVTDDENGCFASATVEVNSDVNPPQANAGEDAILSCDQTVISLQGDGSGGDSLIYYWSTVDGNIVDGAQTENPLIDAPGNYLLTVINTGNGCSATDEVTVTENDDIPIALIAEPDSITCLVDEVTLYATASQGPDFEYKWNTADGNFTSIANPLAPIVDAAGTYVFTVLDTVNNCSKTTSVTVGANVEQPVANAGGLLQMDCYTSISYLDGTGSSGYGSMSYFWETTDGNILSGVSSPTPGIDTPGLYQLTVTNLDNGCTDSDEVIVSRDMPVAEMSLESLSCMQESGAIVFGNITGGVAPYIFSIDGGASFTSLTAFYDLGPGIYNTVVQDSNGCEYAETLEITSPDPLQLSVEPFVEIHLGDSHQIQTHLNVPLSEITGISWTPTEGLSCSDCLDPVASPLYTTQYHLTVQTPDGCEASGSLLLVVDKSDDLYVPNVFSPNDDGINDKFTIFADPENVIKIKSFLVFSRWGETVFQYFNFTPNNPAFGWNGKHREQPLDPGVFVWFAVVEYIDGREVLYKGDVTLVR